MVCCEGRQRDRSNLEDSQLLHSLPPSPSSLLSEIICFLLLTTRLLSTSTMEAPPPLPPVALHEDNVPRDLICSICMTVPADPRITPCNHLFCHACIHQALDNQYLCPIDRQPCSPHQLRPLDGFISRVWGGIQVKCGYHEHGCVWRGSIADYSAHLENCSISNNPTIRDNAAAKEELERLKRENVDLRRQLYAAAQAS